MVAAAVVMLGHGISSVRNCARLGNGIAGALSAIG
jgi:hypothetical protein